MKNDPVQSPSEAKQNEPPEGGGATGRRRRFWLWLAVICLAGVAARVVIINQYVTENPFATGPRVDAKVYWQWAQRIADGHLIQDQPFFSAPLYPYLLGVLRAFGGTLTSVYVVQALVDILAACLLARLCRNRFGVGVGLLAAGLYLFLQEPASSSLRVLTSSLQLILLVITWDRLVAVQEDPTLRRRLGVGAAIGFLCLSHPPAMLFVPFVGLWLFWQSSRRAKDVLRAAVPVILACVIIAPATLHNWYVSGDLFLIQSATAVNLRQGNAPGANGTYTPIPNTTLDREGLFEDVARQYLLATGQQGSWKQIDGFYRDQVLEFWRSDPVGTLRLIARKVYWFLTGRVYGDIYAPALEIAGGFAGWLRLTPIQVAWLIGPAIVGLVVMLRRPIRHAPELVMFAIPLLVVAVFWYSPRYRLPAVPVIVGVAAWALVRAIRWRDNPGFSVAAAFSVLLALGLGPVNQSRGFDTSEELAPWWEVSVGVRYEEQGDTAGARRHYERAMQLRPQDTGALTRLARLAFQEGRGDEAVRLFQEAAASDPYNAQWQGNLGKILASQGRHDEAIAAFEAAMRLDPSLASVHGDLADLYVQMKEPQKAVEQRRIALSKAPSQVDAYFQLAATLEGAGEMVEAEATYRAALKVAPQNSAARVRVFELCVRADRAKEGEAFLLEGLAAFPNDLELITSLAWLYATFPDSELRDGRRAVSLAERACQATRRQNARYLDILAASYAEARRFPEAITACEEAIRLVQQQGPAHILPALRYRLQLYQDGEPFHWRR